MLSTDDNNNAYRYATDYGCIWVSVYTRATYYRTFGGVGRTSGVFEALTGDKGEPPPPPPPPPSSGPESLLFRTLVRNEHRAVNVCVCLS